MNSTTKGSVAAAVAALLLTGGAGTLAFWSDTENVPGGPIASGQLDLGTPACGAGWVLDGGAPLTATQLIVPGDTLTKTCTINLIARGEHLGADLTIGTAAFATPNGLTNELTPTATFTVNGATRSHVTDADDTGATNEIVATIGVTFNGPAATNASQNLTATLNTIAVTATQNHDPS
jgi:alternate signal-mediated exported protein